MYIFQITKLESVFVDCPKHRGATDASPSPSLLFLPPSYQSNKLFHCATIILIYSNFRLVALFCDMVPYASMVSSLGPHTVKCIYGLTWLHMMRSVFPFVHFSKASVIRGETFSGKPPTSTTSTLAKYCMFADKYLG